MEKVSIIIPCFNQGNYLVDAIESIKVLEGWPYEVIIVNDGSTDEFTNDYTRKLQREGYQVIFQENQGLSAARNAGIAKATAPYILPLDADNLVKTPYLKSAVDILDSDSSISVVYSDTLFFENETGIRQPGEFNLQRLMLFNYIDACGLIRRSALEKVGGYDTQLKHGLEDWEMWLRLSFAGYKFYYLREIGYHYRVRSGSMIRTIFQQHEIMNEIENYVNAKFQTYMGHYWITENFVNRFRESPIKILIKLLLRTYWPSKYNKLLKANKIKNGI